MYKLIALYGQSKKSVEIVKLHFESVLGFKFINENEIEKYENKIDKKITILQNLNNREYLLKQPHTYLIIIHSFVINDCDKNSIKSDSSDNLIKGFNHKSGTEYNIKSDIFYESILKIKNNRNVFHIYDYRGTRELILQVPKFERPSWNQYFMEIAFVVSTRSNCQRRMVGCVIVNENKIISTGYNGTASGSTNCFDYGCDRCNSDVSSGIFLEKCMCLHAEENAILQAHTKMDGFVIYTTTFPCSLCAKKIIQLKFRKVYFAENYSKDDFETMRHFNLANIDYEKI
ncbi:Deoxycytidylate deaminase [Dictyocoela muelleri]|nr:Deoxycytidylate deaminase [Dictyocoela muelleri]